MPLVTNLGPFTDTLYAFEYGSVGRDSSFGTFVLIYGLMSHQRPKYAVEIGSHTGATTIWMARAIEEAETGELVSYEIIPAYASATKSRLESAVPFGSWRVETGDFLALYDDKPIDFLFLDPDPKTLYRPMFDRIKWAPGAILAAHDFCLDPPEGRAVVDLADHIKSTGEWESIVFPCERGLFVARRLK